MSWVNPTNLGQPIEKAVFSLVETWSSLYRLVAMHYSALQGLQRPCRVATIARVTPQQSDDVAMPMSL